MIPAMKIRATLLSLVLLVCLALPATAPAHGEPQLFEMKRDDMRIKLYVLHDEVVRAHVRARERCGEGRNATTGFLRFDLSAPEAIAIHGDGRFSYDVTFDDARGHGRLALQGRVHPQTIRGVFLFRNLDDTSCGSGRPGNRRVLYTARLKT
jgi:hypothetical protein